MIFFFHPQIHIRRITTDSLLPRLGEGGDPAKQVCGWVGDKYGLSWQVVPKILPKMITDPDRAAAARALQAMMDMKKLDIAGLKAAFEAK